MEKYGVNESIDSETMEKIASAGCPRCGAPVEKQGNVLACPRCGTEPFEGERLEWRRLDLLNREKQKEPRETR
jgi:uncharacterized Zn finger protein (UPF0148 family)